MISCGKCGVRLSEATPGTPSVTRLSAEALREMEKGFVLHSIACCPEWSPEYWRSCAREFPELRPQLKEVGLLAVSPGETA